MTISARRFDALTLALITLLLAGGAVPQVRAQVAEQGANAPRRVLVAPVEADPDLEGEPLATVLPALLVEAVSADLRFTASLSPELTAAAVEALTLAPGSTADAAALSSKTAPPALMSEGSVRILLLPDIKKRGSEEKGNVSYQVTLRWSDLVLDKGGTASAKGDGLGGFLEAVGEAAGEAREAWSDGWNPSGRSGSAKPDASSRLSAITSPSPDALALWTKARSAWATGDASGAESALVGAIAADAAFDLAKVDLAWIRFGQERTQEAVSLATEALTGTRLSEAARARAEIIVAAGRRDLATLESLAERLASRAPVPPWGPLAGTLRHVLGGEPERAVSLLDGARLFHPRDPILAYLAGIAALGAADDYESVARLEEAVALWPEHDRIHMDLAEARLRARDEAGAREALTAWRSRFRPEEGPIWGGSWSYEDPPPPVRAVEIDLLNGAYVKAIETLEGELSALRSAAAPREVRLAVLMTLHDLQMQLAWGEMLWKHQWLNAGRESFAAIRDLIPSEDREARPWVLDRLEAHLLIREGRTQEAEEFLERILAASDLPGYDPGVEAEIEAAIALKEADRERLYAACQRAVEVRGLISDYLRLAQAYMINREWQKVEVQFQIMEGRLKYWSPTRRQDALLWSPGTIGPVPFIYSLGAQSGVWRGDAETARERFGIFMAYFRSPDKVLLPYLKEAQDRGAKPAW